MLGWPGSSIGRQLGDGLVQAFRRAHSPIEKVRYTLRGLDPEAQYSVSNLDVPGEARFSGRELEQQGLPIAIDHRAAAVIMVYRRVKTVN